MVGWENSTAAACSSPVFRGEDVRVRIERAERQ
jgi:hypothetical protein